MDRFGDLMGDDDESKDIEMSAPHNSYAKLFEETNEIKKDIARIQ